MEDSVEDGTEGGYTAYPADHPGAYRDYYRRTGAFWEDLAEELAKDCPDPDCICKRAQGTEQE